MIITVRPDFTKNPCDHKSEDIKLKTTLALKLLTPAISSYIFCTYKHLSTSNTLHANF